MKLLLVEDSDRLRKTLETGLARSGYAVDAVENGKLALDYSEAFEYTVIILDLMIPEVDGLTVLKRLRSGGCKAGVLILSAKDQIEDRITGLEYGADDYLIKPFSFDELVARVGALTRRSSGSPSPILKLGDLELNTANHSLVCAGKTVSLTPSEQRIVEYLAMRRGRVISASNLEEHIYSSGASVSKNSIEVHISAIRKKIAKHTKHSLIQTRRGFGYVIEI